MLKIQRDRTKVKFSIDPEMFDGKVISVDWECNSEWYAYFVVDRCEVRLWEALKIIRERAYERGWKDAKSKKKKCTWFSGSWMG